MNAIRTTRRRLGAAIALAGAVVMTIAGCSGGGSSGSGAALSIANVTGATWTCGFNPFNPAVNLASFGLLYEPLIYVNTLKNAAQTPMLATAATWSDGYRTLTLTTRHGIKWSDGKAFGAADVAFTFNLLKKYPGLDLNALWSSGLTSVTQSGSDHVVLKFSSPSQPYFYYVADQTPIVPQHVWSTVKNPVDYADTKPVVTGPYTVGACSPQNIRYTANATYWQPGKPAVKTVNYPSYTDNGPANQDLAGGKAQWGGQFIPSVDKYYTARDPKDFHTWFPAISNVDLALNLKDPVTKDVRVRQALAYAVDRSDVAKIGESGEQPAANQTGVVRPTFNDWVDTAAAAKYDYVQNQAKAEQLLAAAGYSASKPLKLTALTVSGYTDWDASLQEIKQQLAQVHVQLTVQDLAGGTYDSRVAQGHFQAAYISETGGPTPYYELRQLLYSGNTAPVGKTASTNYSRFSDPSVDKLITAYASASSTAQHAIVDQLQGAMLADVPVIPMTESVSWFQYDTKEFTGWPTPSNPYSLPGPSQFPDLEQVVLHLTVKK